MFFAGIARSSPFMFNKHEEAGRASDVHPKL